MSRLGVIVVVLVLAGIAGCRAGPGSQSSPSLTAVSPHLDETSSPTASASASVSASPSPTRLPSPSAASWTGFIPSEPTGPELGGEPISARDADESFALTLTASQDRYRAGQLIDVSVTLELLGPESDAIMLGSGSGLVGFGVKSSDPSVIVHPVSTTDCRPHPIRQGEPQVFPFVKSGGYSPGDPADAFAEAYLATKDLRLPAGKWTIFAGSGFYAGADCGAGPLHSLGAEVTVTVEP